MNKWLGMHILILSFLFGYSTVSLSMFGSFNSPTNLSPKDKNKKGKTLELLLIMFFFFNNSSFVFLDPGNSAASS
jgi:hypothetical protein